MRWGEVGERVGYCDLTGPGDEGCRDGRRKGTWSETPNIAQCFERCRTCTRCRFVSFSAQHRSCDWFAACGDVKTALSRLHRTYRLRDGDGAFRNATLLLDAIRRHSEWPASKPLDFFERPRSALFHQQSASSVYAHSDTPVFRRMHVPTTQGKRPLTPADLSEWARLISQRAALPESGFGSCVVVGSSGELLGRRLGGQIEIHDAVWRVNTARVDAEHRIDVGSRTSVRVWGFMVPPPTASRLQPGEVVLMRCPADQYVSQCWYSIPEIPWPRISPLEHRRLSLAIFGPRTAGRIRALRAHPSTGAMAVWAALSVCENVSVVGYGGCSPEGVMHYDRGRSVRGRLDQRWNITTAMAHNMPAEWEWLERLAAEGIIRRVGGWRFQCDAG